MHSKIPHFQKLYFQMQQMYRLLSISTVIISSCLIDEDVLMWFRQGIQLKKHTFYYKYSTVVYYCTVLDFVVVVVVLVLRLILILILVLSVSLKLWHCLAPLFQSTCLKTLFIVPPILIVLFLCLVFAPGERCGL